MNASLPTLFSFVLVSQALAANPVTVDLDEPDYDRWMYPFNGTPGSRVVGPTFAAFGYDTFDERDGQNLYGFHTDAIISAGLGPSSYRVVSATMTLMIENGGIIYDDSADAWETHVEGGEDVDPGQEVLLSGARFRGDYDGWSFGETGAFGPFGAGTRNAYPIDFDADGLVRDISNNVLNEFQPNPFAVGTVDGLDAGDTVPELATYTFSLNVDDPDIQCYLRSALNDGLVSLIVSSFHAGSQDGSGSYPQWICKENSLVFVGLADAAGLEMTVEVVEPSGIEGDVDGDGLVGVTDLLDVISDWGRCPCCPTDLNDDGFVDVNELLNVISNWGG
ncbi:MAG: hypothetical protein MK095_04140 [Phycisphaerales bacterium]|nr:hypothetical protein [Phycisphaerales bacterium]